MLPVFERIPQHAPVGPAQPRAHGEVPLPVQPLQPGVHEVSFAQAACQGSPVERSDVGVRVQQVQQDVRHAGAARQARGRSPRRRSLPVRPL